ncbi:MAG: ATP-binding protein [Pseudomonadota bacterium]
MSHATMPRPPIAEEPSVEARASLRRALQALVGLTAFLAIAGTAWFLLHLRAESIRAAEERAAVGARLLEEHVVRTFRATEFIIDRVVDLGERHPIAELARSKAAWHELKTLSRGLPEPGTLWIVDARGRVALGTIAFPMQPNDVTDRFYFHAHKAQRQGLVVGPMVTAKSRDLQAFHLSKRIEDEGGGLIGVAVAGFDVPYFTDFYHSLGLGSRSALTIFRQDGQVVMRQPEPGRWIDASVAGGPTLTAATTRPHGILHAVSPLDGVERIAAYRRLDSFGVVVLCSVAMDDALAGWWRSVAIAGVLLVGVGGVLAIVGNIAFAGLRREATLMHGLEERIRERTEEARFQAEEARRANESKTRYLAAASHDLRQPLQAAGMFVEALSARMAGSPHFPILDKLRQSVDATQALLSTLLDASTLEAGRVEPRPAEFPVATLLATLVDQTEPEAARKGLRLGMVASDAWVASDPVLLERMLRNLLVNALRYTESGGVLLGCRRRGDCLAIQVVDTGPGIPPDQQVAVFDDFVRLGDKGGATSRGLGLGLAVVRRMAALMGHELELRSVVGKGSAFAVVVPLAQRRLSSGVEAGSASSRVMAENVAPRTQP